MQITSQRIDSTGHHVVEFGDTGLYAKSADGRLWNLYHRVVGVDSMLLEQEVRGTDRLCERAEAYV